MGKSRANELLVNIQQSFKEVKDKYSSYENNINTHIKQNKESLEKLGLTEQIVVNNGFKLGTEEYDKLSSKYSKSKVSNDVNIANSLIEKATVMTKSFILEYHKYLEDKKKFVSDIDKSIEAFESEKAFDDFLIEREEYFTNLRNEIFDFIDKDLEEHINSFDELKKYKNIYLEIVAEYDISARKSHNIHTELNEVFSKSYIV